MNHNFIQFYFKIILKNDFRQIQHIQLFINENSKPIFSSNSVPRLNRTKAVFAFNLIKCKGKKKKFFESHEMIYHFNSRYEIKRTIRFWYCVQVSTFSPICNASIIFTKKYPCICCKVKQLENLISYHILPHANTHAVEKRNEIQREKFQQPTNIECESFIVNFIVNDK